MKSVESVLNNEYHQLPLFYFVSFLFGILAYFSLENEPVLRHILMLFASSFSLLYLRRLGIIWSFVSIMVIFFAGGILAGTMRTFFIHPTGLSYNIKSEITGKIESIKPKITGTQIILSHLTFDKELEQIPQKIRVNVRTNMNGAITGDYVRLHASIGPPPKAALPGSYDFSRGAFFANIGAVGYALSDIELIERPEQNDAFIFVLELRRNIYHKIIAAIGPERGNFAAALMLGETSALEREVIQNMRAAGISHILAVSGLHLSLVAMICFFLFRLLFNIIPYSGHYMDVKQLAAIFAFIGSFFYLLISGMQVAAIRAFIMTSIVILAIIFKRFPSPMRSVCFAAFMILLFYPEYALHPSFHLSFVAVISLLAGYEFYIGNILFSSSSSMFYGLKIYIFSNIYSTIVASLATAPFVIYHFYIYSNYSVFANLVAVPLTSFLIMPAAIFTFFLLPFGCEYIPLKIMDLGIKYILQAAAYIESMPHSIWYFGHISAISLFIYAFGFLWFCFFKTKFRIAGIAPIVVSIIMMLQTPKPDIIIGGRDASIAVNKNGVLVIEDSANLFMKDYWTSWFGQKETVTTSAKYWDYDLEVQGKKISKRYNNFVCEWPDIMINLSNKYLRCKYSKVINKRDIKSNGTHIVFIFKDSIKIVNQESKRFKTSITAGHAPKNL
jgi:competence protein ComEC